MTKRLAEDDLLVLGEDGCGKRIPARRAATQRAWWRIGVKVAENFAARCRTCRLSGGRLDHLHR